MPELAEEFRSILEKFSSDLGENVLFITLFTPDGISLYDSLPDDVGGKDFLMASCSALVQISESLTEQVGLENLERCILRTRVGSLILTAIGKDIYLGVGVRNEEEAIWGVDSLVRDLRSYFGGEGMRD